MTNKELIEILHNIPQEVFQSKNHEKLYVIINSEVPRLNLYTSKKFTAIEFTLFKTMQYRIWHDLTYEDITNQIESYLNILGFTKAQPSYTSNAIYPPRYTPNIGVAINNTMTDTEIMKLIQYELGLDK